MPPIPRHQSPVTDLTDVDGDVVVNCSGPPRPPAPTIPGVMPHGMRVVLGRVAQPGDTSLAAVVGLRGRGHGLALG